MYEEENTVRALSDKPLLATGRWCWVGFHKWTKYAKPKQRQEGVWAVDYQARECADCGLMDVKILRKV